MPLFFIAMIRWCRENPKLVGGIFAVFFVIGLALGLYWKGRSDDHAANVRAEAAQRVAIDARAQKATNTADTQRAADTQAVNTSLAQATEAIHAQKDSAPSDASLALNCRRLLRQGTPLSKIPACGRFAGTR
jgi:Tfp pilus assembly protein PilO